MKKVFTLLLMITLFTSCSSDDSGSTNEEPITNQKYFKLEKVIDGGYTGEPILYKNDEVLNGTAFSQSYPVLTNDVVTVQLNDAGGEVKIIYSISKNGVREMDTIRATDTNIGIAVNSYTDIIIQ